MYTPKLPLLALLIAAASPLASAAEGPNLGLAPTPATLFAADISIAPDGRGLPPGKGNAQIGERLYQERCALCHGVKGENGLHDRLSGGIGSLTTDKPIKTVGSYWPYATTLFDYIRRAMPYFTPRTLNPDETYALTAYLLYTNGIIEQRKELNAATLPKVVMPNRAGFRWSSEVAGAK